MFVMGSFFVSRAVSFRKTTRRARFNVMKFVVVLFLLLFVVCVCVVMDVLFVVN